jgi:hypothetical protein
LRIAVMRWVSASASARICAAAVVGSSFTSDATTGGAAGAAPAGGFEEAAVLGEVGVPEATTVAAGCWPG